MFTHVRVHPVVRLLLLAFTTSFGLVNCGGSPNPGLESNFVTVDPTNDRVGKAETHFRQIAQKQEAEFNSSESQNNNSRRQNDYTKDSFTRSDSSEAFNNLDSDTTPPRRLNDKGVSWGSLAMAAGILGAFSLLSGGGSSLTGLIGGGNTDNSPSDSSPEQAAEAVSGNEISNHNDLVSGNSVVDESFASIEEDSTQEASDEIEHAVILINDQPLQVSFGGLNQSDFIATSSDGVIGEPSLPHENCDLAQGSQSGSVDSLTHLKMILNH